MHTTRSMAGHGNPDNGSAKNPEARDEPTVRKVRVPYALTPELAIGFAQDWPDRQVGQANPAHAHSHARLAYERREIEREIYEQCTGQECIVDIGGNPKRHRKRPEVWSCCPILSAEDACRESQRAGIPLKYCNCKFQHCNCIPNPDVYISIHSLYYLSVGDVLEAVHRCHTGKLYAMVHEFPDAAGKFAGGEASYYQLGMHQVQMSVKGNSSTYQHSNMHWLRDGYFSTSTQAVAWTLWKQGPHSNVYLFSRAPLGLFVQKPQVKTLSGSLKDKDFYGGVMSGSTGLGRHLATTGFGSMVATVDSISCYGRYFELRTGTEQKMCLVPKGFVEDLMVKIAWMPRNPTTWRAFVEKAKSLVVKFDMPDQLRADCLTYGPILAFQATAESESGLLHHMWRTYAVRFNFLNKQLDGPSWVLPSWVLKSTTGLLIALFMRFHPRHSRKLIVLLFLAWTTRHFYTKWQRNQSLLLLEQGYKLYNGTGQSFYGPAGIVEHAPVFLHTTNSPVDRGTIRDGASLVTPDHLTNNTTAAMVGLGVLCPTRIPIVYAGNGHNEELSFSNRALMITPKVDQKEFATFEAWVKVHINELLNDIDVEPVVGKYYHWNNRFPPSKQRKHNEARQALSYGPAVLDIDAVCRRRAFTKREKLDQGDFEPNFKTARMIQGCSDTFNVIVGPWVHAFSKFLGEKWNIDSDIYYCTGVTANAVGQWYEQVQHMIAMEDDFSKFDTTISRAMLELELWVFERYGCPRRALELMAYSIKTKGYGRHGCKYSVDGTRHSGDPQTSVGNSMLNGFVHAYALHKHANGVHPYGRVRHRMAVIGDDNALGVEAVPDLRAMQDTLVALGFLPNLKLKEWQNVEFCSGRFYPSDKGYILGPKIGKCLQKVGWFLDANAGQQTALLYSTGIGMQRDCNHIPILRAVADLMVRAAKKKNPKVTASVAECPYEKGRPRATCKGELVPEVYHMIDSIYHLTESECQVLEEHLNSINNLPASFTHPLLQTLFEQDA